MRPQQAVVVVTGGNDGIGLQLVTALLEAGHRVAVMDLSDERLPMLASRFPHGILSYRCDVANRAAVRDVVKKVAAARQLPGNCSICPARLRPPARGAMACRLLFGSACP